MVSCVGFIIRKASLLKPKLVRVIRSAVLDVAIDLRKDSTSFGKHIAIEINEDNKIQMCTKRTFAQGYVILEDNTIFNYKCDNYYAPRHEGGVNWADKTLAIDWKIRIKDLIVSEKDAFLSDFIRLVIFLIVIWIC
jgi:dTDP-4-dehydrorhamnose 3,5-epimerase